ncbi:hypothetical protein ACFU53_43875 [Streptomyces sp. NPDC057474]|uniref:hypothetical protein n=1 Tax=Streptomyces sp. NPDC057474 TaxID=3346144 RepID=UPI003674B918
MRTKPTMGKRMLRSVLAAAFSAVVAFGALSGLSDAKGGVKADSVWPVVTPKSEVVAGDDLSTTPVAPEDSVWA